MSGPHEGATAILLPGWCQVVEVVNNQPLPVAGPATLVAPRSWWSPLQCSVWFLHSAIRIRMRHGYRPNWPVPSWLKQLGCLQPTFRSKRGPHHKVRVWMTVLGSNHHKAHQCQSHHDSLNCGNSKTIFCRESWLACPLEDSGHAGALGSQRCNAVRSASHRACLSGKGQRLSYCPRGPAQRWLNNEIVTTDRTLDARSATEVARESRRACPPEDSCQ